LIVRLIATGVFLIAALPLSAPRWAAAEDSTSDADRATARALAHEGYEAQKQGRYSLAADRFERAEALVDAPTLLLGLARAQAALGKIVEANESYRRILRKPLAPDAPPAFAKAVADARREAATVAERLAWVTFDVKGPATPQVVLDEVAVPAAALGVPLACNPGAHTVRASAEGAFSVEKSFAIGDGATETVSLALQPQPEAPVAAAAEPDAPGRVYDDAPPAPAPRLPFVQRTAGFTALGIGLAGLAVGGVVGVLALNRHASLSDACPDGHCSPHYAGQVDTYRTLANASTAATIVGATGVATGTILLLTAPRSTSVHVYAGALSAGIAGRF
jgi:hypothetical protein